jgi:hypothetical protein
LNRLDPLEIVDLARIEGPRGISRWVNDHLASLRDGTQTTQSLYREAKEQSVGSAILFALALKRRKLLPPDLDLELKEIQAGNRYCWVTGVCHILTPSILDRVRGAFEAGDTLCGLHRYYCGASAPGPVVFKSFPDFEEHLRIARPGDEFMLASIQQLAERGQLLEPTRASIRSYLASGGSEEVMLARTGLHPPRADMVWEGNLDEDEVESWFTPGKGVYALPFSWEQEFFVDAKKPDDSGAIPLGGAY